MPPTVPDDAPVRTFFVRTDRSDGGYYSARTPSKAKGQAFQNYRDAWGGTFRDFMSLNPRVSVRPTPPHLGKRVLVLGKPATTCIAVGGTIDLAWAQVGYIYDGSDQIVRAHPSDVVPLGEPSAILGAPAPDARESESTDDAA